MVPMLNKKPMKMHRKGEYNYFITVDPGVTKFFFEFDEATNARASPTCNCYGFKVFEEAIGYYRWRGGPSGALDDIRREHERLEAVKADLDVKLKMW